MGTIALLLRIAALAAPSAAFLALLRRLGRGDPGWARRIGLAAATVLGGAIAFVPAWLVERWLVALAGLDDRARGAADLTTLVYAFLVTAPLEQGLKVAAMAPAWRSRTFATRGDGVLHASAAALGFVTARSAVFLAGRGAASIDLARVLLAAPAHLFFAAAWGYALGREAQSGGGRRAFGRAFRVTWLLATLFNGVYDHIVFARSGAALIAAAPMLAGMAATAIYVGRDLAAPAGTEPDGRRHARIAAPSIGEVRAALTRTERPLMLGWIAFGALVTTGVITALVASAVVLGHRLGVDFAAVDRAEGSAGAAPLALLGAAALSAFPIAGYLVARASATRSVLEPAIAAALAIAGSLVLLGLASPVAVVFAIAFAPVAFGLACAGAWMGIAR